MTNTKKPGGGKGRVSPAVTDIDIDGDNLLAPRSLTKQEFGRRLHRMILDRGWNQSELARRADIGRDAVSTYVNGRSFPDPKNLQKICMALGVEPKELLPNSIETKMDREIPAFEMRQAAGDPSKVWLRINRAVQFSSAAAIVEILRKEQEQELDKDS